MTMTLHAARLPAGAALGMAGLTVSASADSVLNASPMAGRWPVAIALVLAVLLLLAWARGFQARRAPPGDRRQGTPDEGPKITETFHPVPREVMNDFNNSLATIAYAIDLSLKHELPEKPASYLMTALSAVERGQQLTDRMIRVAEQNDGAVATRSVEMVLNNVKALIGPTLDAGIALTVVCEDRSLTLRCNQSKLETALVGFVVHCAVSMKAEGMSGQITIKARLAGPSPERDSLVRLHEDGADFVEISVFNDSVAFNASAAKNLAGASDFAHEAGGCVTMTADAVLAASIGFILPLDVGVEGKLRTQAVTPPRGIGETIFVVEDEAMFLLMLQEELEDLGYRVISATSGEAAMGLIEQGVGFDLVITDVMLPGKINGFDLATKIRDQHHRAEVLYMSGYSGFTKDEMGPVEAPILRKPCAPGDLATAVREALIKRMN